MVKKTRIVLQSIRGATWCGSTFDHETEKRWIRQFPSALTF